MATGYFYVTADTNVGVTSRVEKVDAQGNSAGAVVVGSVRSTFRPAGCHWDGSDLWVWDKQGRAISRFNGFSTSETALYSFTSNTDVNSLNAFVGAWVDVPGQTLWAQNFVNRKVIQGGPNFSTASDTTNTPLDLSSFASTPTSFEFYNGDLYVQDFSNKDIERFSGWSTTSLGVMSVSAQCTGNNYGMSFTQDGYLVTVDQVSGTSGGRLIVYDGFQGNFVQYINLPSPADQLATDVYAGDVNWTATASGGGVAGSGGLTGSGLASSDGYLVG